MRVRHTGATVGCDRDGCVSAEAGFALPLTLIVLALLTTLSVGLLHRGAAHIDNVSVLKARWQGELQIRDALQQVMWSLLSGKQIKGGMYSDGKRIPLDGTFFKLGSVEVAVQDGAGLIGLEFYSELRVKGLLMQLGLRKKETAILAARLGDWVDSDSVRSVGGMEKSDYSASADALMLRNHPLRTLDEVMEVPGFTRTLFNGVDGRMGLRDLLETGGGMFNYATAPEQAIRAYLQLGDAKMQALLEARKEGRWGEVARIVLSASGNVGLMQSGTRFLVVIKSGNGMRGRFDLRLLPEEDGRPFRINAWQMPDYPRG